MTRKKKKKKKVRPCFGYPKNKWREYANTDLVEDGLDKLPDRVSQGGTAPVQGVAPRTPSDGRRRNVAVTWCPPGGCQRAYGQLSRLCRNLPRQRKRTEQKVQRITTLEHEMGRQSSV